MKKTKSNRGVYPSWKFLLLAFYFYVLAGGRLFAQNTNLESVNAALLEETDNIIATGRIVANIVVVIAFVLLMLNIVFKVMDNSKATVTFILIIILRGLFEVIF